MHIWIHLFIRKAASPPAVLSSPCAPSPGLEAVHVTIETDSPPLYLFHHTLDVERDATAEWVILGKALYLEIKGGVSSQCVWQGMEWGEEGDFSSHLPQSQASLDTLVGGPRDEAAGEAGLRTFPMLGLRGQALATGKMNICYKTGETTRHMAVSSETSMQIPAEALLPVRCPRKVAAGALGIRGDSRSPGDCSRDAGEVPERPAACCRLAAFLAGRMSLFQEPKGLGATERGPRGL